MHPTVTDRQLAALKDGSGQLLTEGPYAGRIVPVVRGGSDLQIEAVPDGGGTVTDVPPDQTDLAAAPNGDATPEPEAPEAAASPSGFSPDDPAFIEAVQREAAAMFHQQQAAFQQPAPTPDQAQPLDLDQYLNPLEDTFGSNLGKFLSDRDEYLLNKVSELLTPVTSAAQQTEQTKALELVDSLIGERWNEATDGKLDPDVSKTIRDLAPAYLDEMNSRYGKGPTAAREALVKATETIRAINKRATGTGASQNAAELAQLANAAATPTGGTPALQGAGPAETVDDALSRWKARNTATPQAA